MNPVRCTCILMVTVLMCITETESSSWRDTGIVIGMRRALRNYVKRKTAGVKAQNTLFNTRLGEMEKTLADFLEKELTIRTTLDEYARNNTAEQMLRLQKCDGQLREQKETMDEFINAGVKMTTDLTTKMEKTAAEHLRNFQDFEASIDEWNETFDEHINTVVVVRVALKEGFHQSTTQQEKLLSDLAVQLGEQEKTMEEILDREKTVVFFKAAYDDTNTQNEPTLQTGEVLPYSIIADNVGRGFDGRSFTAPVAGYYSFYISMETTQSSHIDVVLRTEGGVIVAKLRAGDPETQAYSRASGLIILEGGQSVMPVIDSVSGTFSVVPDGTSELCGILRKADYTD